MPIQTPLGETDLNELEPQVMSVRVTNRNEFTIRDRFDGVLYTFEPHRPVSVPIDAANHIFAWHPPWTDDKGERHEVERSTMRTHVQKRFGWNTPEMQNADRSQRFFDNLEITPVIYRMVPVEVDEAGNTKRAPKTNKLMAAADEAAARV